MKRHSYLVSYFSTRKLGDIKTQTYVPIRPQDISDLREHISDTICNGDDVVITSIFYFGEFEHESEDGEQ